MISHSAEKNWCTCVTEKCAFLFSFVPYIFTCISLQEQNLKQKHSRKSIPPTEAECHLWKDANQLDLAKLKDVPGGNNIPKILQPMMTKQSWMQFNNFIYYLLTIQKVTYRTEFYNFLYIVFIRCLCSHSRRSACIPEDKFMLKSQVTANS